MLSSLQYIWTFVLSSLVISSCLAASVPAASEVPEVPEDIHAPITLKASNFISTIEHGTWWVDFFSPYCPHCTKLAPVWADAWKSLQNDVDGIETKHDFHMAKVDCVEDGDLCDDQKIQAYPSLKLFRDGKFETSYDDRDRSAVKLINFAKDNLEANPSSSAVSETQISASIDVPAATGSSSSEIGTLHNSPESFAAGGTESFESEFSVGGFPKYPGPQSIVNTEYPGGAKIKTATSSLASSSSSIRLQEGAPNPEGISVPLDHTSFTRKITATEDPWFVKFYSPRCPHCAKMKAAWEEMARAVRGKINIGEVNCDVQKQLCKDAQIDSLPGLFYFRGSTKISYNSLRGFSDLLDFANGAVAARDLQDVSTITELNELITTTHPDKSTFVYFYDSTTVAEDFEALKRVALNTLENARIYKSNSSQLIKKLAVPYFPSLYAVSDPLNSKWIQYEAPSPKDIRDYGRISNWVKEIWLSFVPQLTPVNAQEIFDHAQYVVLGLIDPRNSKEKDRAINELKFSAQKYLDDIKKEDLEELMSLRAKKQLKIDEAADRGDERAEDQAKKIKVQVTPKPVVGFAWIDSVFWNRWLKGKFGVVNDGNSRPVVIINDDSGNRYWDTNISGGSIGASRSIIVETLEAVMQSPPRIKPRVVITGFSSFVLYIQETISQHWIASSAVVIAIFVYFSKRRKNRGYSDLSLPLHHQPDTGKRD